MMIGKMNVFIDGVSGEMPRKDLVASPSGRPYDYYLADGSVDLVREQELALVSAKKVFLEILNAKVQEPIDSYNITNGTLFESVHNCATYKDVLTYPHQAFCTKMVEYNALIWETGRGIEADVLAQTIPMPTPKEFIGMLPEFIE